MPLSPGLVLAPVCAFAIPAFKGCTDLTLWLKVTSWTRPINPACLLLTLNSCKSSCCGQDGATSALVQIPRTPILAGATWVGLSPVRGWVPYLLQHLWTKHCIVRLCPWNWTKKARLQNFLDKIRIHMWIQHMWV